MTYWDHVKPVKRSRAVDAQRIAAEACGLLDEGGEQALSLRSLAQRIGVAAASLYSRVDSLDDVMDLALDHALTEDTHVQTRLTKATDAEGLLVAYYNHLVAHPWAIGVIARRPPRGPGYLQFSEALCARLIEAGLPHPLATAYAASNYVLGCAATWQASVIEPGSNVDVDTAPVYAGLQGILRHSPEALLRLGLRSLLDSGVDW